MNRREAALTITLTGPGIGEGRLALAELVHVGRNLQAALERIALVLRGEATSLKPGRRPADVTGLCRFDLVGFRGGSAVLELELAGAERPFEIMDLGEAALDRMVEGLQRVSEGPSLPPGWDTGVLVAWRELGSIFDRGVDHIEVARAKRTGVSVVRYTPAVRDQIVQRIRGPMHDLLTVEGRLLMADFDEAHRRCRVHPSYGPPVACIFREDQREAILDLLTKYVRVVGQAERDEEHGRVRVVTISDIEPIEIPGDPGGADFWEHPSVEELAQRQVVRPVERPEDLAADVWESDSELEEFLADTYGARATGSWSARARRWSLSSSTPTSRHIFREDPFRPPCTNTSAARSCASPSSRSASSSRAPSSDSGASDGFSSSRRGFGTSWSFLYTGEIGRVWGRVSAECEAKGQPIPPNDAWIAACCLSHDVPLMTLNRRHFEQVEGLRLVPPAPVTGA